MDSPVSEQPNRYLIAIGSPSCPAIGLRKLENVEGDIRRIVKILTDPSQGYETALKEIDLYSTANDIKKGLTNWFTTSGVKSSDYVIVYYAGHGDDGVGKRGYHYLLTVDSKSSNLPNTAIRTDSLVDCLFEGDGERPNILLILDVCYAGQGGDQFISALTNSPKRATDSEFWIISSVNNLTEAADGAFVDAFEQVIAQFDQTDNFDEFVGIPKLVKLINARLEENCLAQNKPKLKAEFNTLSGTGKDLFIKHPRYAERNLNSRILENRCQNEILISDENMSSGNNERNIQKLERAAASITSALNYTGNLPVSSDDRINAFNLVKETLDLVQEIASEISKAANQSDRRKINSYLNDQHSGILSLLRTARTKLYGLPIKEQVVPTSQSQEITTIENSLDSVKKKIVAIISIMN